MSIVAPSGCAVYSAQSSQVDARSVGRLIIEFLPYPGTVLGLLVPMPGQNQAFTGW
jgi:hypothetical protein